MTNKNDKWFTTYGKNQRWNLDISKLYWTQIRDKTLAETVMFLGSVKKM